jgi:chemotaxis protein CheD
MASIIIGIAEMGVVRAPDSLMTIGLGSCVGLVLYDAAAKVGGMAHIMLPTALADAHNRAKYADTGFEDLLHRVLAMGAARHRLMAKMAGGARMFGAAQHDVLRVGERNVQMCRALLTRHRIPITGEDTGGQTGRTIEFFCDTAALKIRTAWPRTERVI